MYCGPIDYVDSKNYVKIGYELASATGPDGVELGSFTPIQFVVHC